MISPGVAGNTSGTNPCVHHTSAVAAAALAIYGRAKVPAAAIPKELRSTDRRLRFLIPVFLPYPLGASKRAPLSRASINRRLAVSTRNALSQNERLRLRNRVFREDLLGPLERLVDCLFRRHPVVHDVDHGDTEDVLGIDIGHSRVERLVKRKGRTDQGLFGVGRAMRVLLKPKWVALGDFGQRQRPSAEPALQILV